MKTEKFKVNNEEFIIMDNDDKKMLMNAHYNYIFYKDSGVFVRFGKNIEDDSPLEIGLPEIADIEISTICSGVHSVCKFCYKSNTPSGKYMTLDTFKKIFHKLPKTITQIAFGIGDLDSNPDMFDIFKYSKENGIIPNVTINGFKLTDDYAKRISELCGAIAVSCYDRDICYDAIEKLTTLGMKQVNIHQMISEETYDNTLQILNDIKNDNRLKNMNAIVFLSLKSKGRAEKNNYNRLSDDKFKYIINYAFEHDIKFGFDSCSAFKFLKHIENNERYNEISQYVDPCESSIYSLYINTDGVYFPCSFIENSLGWENGLDVVNCNDFLNDIWYNEKTIDFRNKVIKCHDCKESCPTYKI